jgi:hypothetical protein
MRKELIILLILFSVFLAIGCSGNKPTTPTEKVTPVKEATPVKEVTKTTIAGNNTTVAKTTIAGNNTTVTKATITGNNTPPTKVVSITERKKEMIEQAENNTSNAGVIKVTPNTGR